MTRVRYLASLRRPRLLAKAARAGLKHYVRDVHLDRVLSPTDRASRGASLFDSLRSLEADIEEARRAQTADYSVKRHVAVLVALLAEAHDGMAQSA